MLVEDAGRHGGQDDAQLVICHYCRQEGTGPEETVHPVGVKVYPVNGTTEVKVDHNGTEIRPTAAAETQRGASVVLRFRCESGGHEWESEMRFHKGITSVTDTRLPDYDVQNEGPLTLWRD